RGLGRESCRAAIALQLAGSGVEANVAERHRGDACRRSYRVPGTLPVLFHDFTSATAHIVTRRPSPDNLVEPCMKRFRRTILGLALVTALAHPASADVITDWNRTAVAVMNNAKTVLNPQARNLAMMHVAMSDAVNSVQNKYSTYAPGLAPAPGASA